MVLLKEMVEERDEGSIQKKSDPSMNIFEEWLSVPSNRAIYNFAYAFATDKPGLSLDFLREELSKQGREELLPKIRDRLIEELDRFENTICAEEMEQIFTRYLLSNNRKLQSRHGDLLKK